MLRHLNSSHLEQLKTIDCGNVDVSSPATFSVESYRFGDCDHGGVNPHRIAMLEKWQQFAVCEGVDLFCEPDSAEEAPPLNMHEHKDLRSHSVGTLNDKHCCSHIMESHREVQDCFCF